MEENIPQNTTKETVFLDNGLIQIVLKKEITQQFIVYRIFRPKMNKALLRIIAASKKDQHNYKYW